eukprot:scaffold69251_cov37-Tisochrysis_lutea.AAC.1
MGQPWRTGNIVFASIAWQQCHLLDHSRDRKVFSTSCECTAPKPEHFLESGWSVRYRKARAGLSGAYTLRIRPPTT